MKKVFILQLLLLIAFPLFLNSEQMGEATKLAMGGDVLIYHGDRSRKQIALTIDDGWTEDDDLLELLDYYNIQCTVFIPGRIMDSRPGFIKKLHRYGHEICTHTQTHSHLTRLTEEKIRWEITTSQKTLTALTGETIKLIRPPGGMIDDRVTHIIASMGYKIVMWDNDVLGYWKDQTIQAQLDYLHSKEAGGNIILSHFGSRLHTYEVLKIYIPEMLAKGYEFVTVSELMKPEI